MSSAGNREKFLQQLEAILEGVSNNVSKVGNFFIKILIYRIRLILN